MVTASKYRSYNNIVISEETSLTSQMFLDYCNYSIPTTEEVNALSARIQQGDKEALNELVTRNMRLVVSIACRHQGKGLALEDLIQWGAIGLMRAAKKYDPSRGNHFSTMAVNWIRQQIGRAICDYGYTIRIPVHLHDTSKRISNYFYKGIQEKGNYPTKKDTLKRFNMPEYMFDRAMLALHIQPVSMNELIDDDEWVEFGDVVVDESPGPEEQTINNDLRNCLEKAMECLTERERQIIKKRFGWDDGIGRTLQETGGSADKRITRERVRQIEQKALAKLRANANGLSEWA